MIAKSVQQEIVRRICQVSTPAKIFILGSYAYGNPTPDSDLDIAVICKNVSARAQESVTIRRALKGILHSIDVLVATDEEFEFYSHECGSVFKTIAERGVAIYA
jgi:predicted nucleotidyltransferase